MPTCGMSRQGLLAGTQSQKYKKSEREGGQVQEKGRQRERLIKGERDGTHMAPQVQCCISNPVVKEQRGSGSINHCISLQLQSLLSVWAASHSLHIQLRGTDHALRIHHWRELQVPNQACVISPAPFFLQPQNSLPAHGQEEESLDPGSEVGGQRKGGGVHRCGLFFQIKRVSNNIQQKGSTVHPVERWRGASKDGLLVKTALCFVFSEEYCIVSCDSSSSPFPLLVGFLAHCSLSERSYRSFRNIRYITTLSQVQLMA